MKILGTGLSGLVGSRVFELLSLKYELEFSDEDITDKDSIQKRIENSNSSLVLHLAAKTDVDGCEKDKDKGKEADAWRINVLGTQNIVDSCVKSGKKLIYISTDFVFDGKKETGYTEKDSPSPINWYGKTKYEGELRVQDSNCDFLIARIAYPYRANYDQKSDFARGLIQKIRNGDALSMITDHVMTPTYIDDIVSALDVLIKKNESGVFHIVGDGGISPYDAALVICKIFEFDKSKISKTKREDFFQGRAPRGFNLYLKNDKIKKLGIRMKSFEEGLREIIRTP